MKASIFNLIEEEEEEDKKKKEKKRFIRKYVERKFVHFTQSNVQNYKCVY